MKKLLIIIAVLAATAPKPAAAEPLLQSKKADIKASRDGDWTTLTMTGFDSEKIEVFEVPDPARIVIDIVSSAIPLPKGKQKIDSPCASAVRFGAHIGKIRLVLDRSSTPCTFEESREKKVYTLIVKPSGAVKERPTHFPAETATIATPAPEPAETPDAGSAAAPTVESTPQPTATATAEAQATVTAEPLVASTPEPSGNSLTGIVFTHEDEQPVVRLELKQRTNFKMTRDNVRQYRITISDCGVAQSGLSLPHFPPNDLVGFTLIEAIPGADKLEILVGLDDGMKASAVNKENAIIIHAEPAGF